MTLSDVFFPELGEKKDASRVKMECGHLQPSVQFLKYKEKGQGNDTLKSSRGISMRKAMEKSDDISCLISQMEAMNMHDEANQIRELRRIKRLTDKVISAFEVKKKRFAMRKQKQEENVREYLARKSKQEERELQEKHLRQNCTAFVYRFIVDDARRKADSLVRRRDDVELWIKAYNAALKTHIESIKTG
ncbi:predicted protein [Nematostella vectensis]|uniref:Uncharacterized protein n=1 Tax=Nematostella vectensis TaxID=45351 RepID=A7RGT1_NEMVE|nr:predicted protein [Nematostella vectensis]|eukprot:XP_001641169.1 predicted protein [Nematostella vectensis]